MYCIREKILNKYDKVYFSGKLYNENKIPLANIIIVIEEVSDYSRWVVGYVLTDENGEFSITLNDSNARYKLTVFKDKTMI